MIVGASAPKIKPIAPTPSSNASSELIASLDWARWQSRSGRRPRFQQHHGLALLHGEVAAIILCLRLLQNACTAIREKAGCQFVHTVEFTNAQPNCGLSIQIRQISAELGLRLGD